MTLILAAYPWLLPLAGLGVALIVWGAFELGAYVGGGRHLRIARMERDAAVADLARFRGPRKRDAGGRFVSGGGV